MAHNVEFEISQKEVFRADFKTALLPADTGKTIRNYLKSGLTAG
jgi:hypothetical protein